MSAIGVAVGARSFEFALKLSTVTFWPQGPFPSAAIRFAVEKGLV